MVGNIRTSAVDSTKVGSVRFRALDGWRGVCAVIVATYHFPHRVWPFDIAVFNAGWVYVDFFFVLSGFVISHRYLRHGASLNYELFVAARLRRLYPTHLLAMLAALGVALLLATVKIYFTGALRVDGLGSDGLDFLRVVAAQLLLLQGFAHFNQVEFVVPTWSVSVEFWTNLLFGLLAKHRLLNPKLLTLVALSLIVILNRQNPRTYLDGDSLTNAARCASGFALGALAYSALAVRWRARVPDAWFTMAECACFVLLIFAAYLGQSLTILWALPILFSLCVWTFAFERGAVSRALLSRPLQLLGRRSYSIYLVHALWVSMFYAIGVAMVRLHLADEKLLTLGFWLEYPIYWVAVWISAAALDRGAAALVATVRDGRRDHVESAL